MDIWNEALFSFLPPVLAKGTGNRVGYVTCFERGKVYSVVGMHFWIRLKEITWVLNVEQASIGEYIWLIKIPVILSVLVVDPIYNI